MHKLYRFARDDSAMTTVEYGLVAAVFAMAILGAASLVGWSFPRLLGRMHGAESASIAP